LHILALITPVSRIVAHPHQCLARCNPRMQNAPVRIASVPGAGSRRSYSWFWAFQQGW
jgi:hypothetical protein